MERVRKGLYRVLATEALSEAEGEGNQTLPTPADQPQQPSTIGLLRGIFSRLSSGETVTKAELLLKMVEAGCSNQNNCMNARISVLRREGTLENVPGERGVYRKPLAGERPQEATPVAEAETQPGAGTPDPEFAATLKQAVRELVLEAFEAKALAHEEGVFTLSMLLDIVRDHLPPEHLALGEKSLSELIEKVCRELEAENKLTPRDCGTEPCWGRFYSADELQRKTNGHPITAPTGAMATTAAAVSATPADENAADDEPVTLASLEARLQVIREQQAANSEVLHKAAEEAGRLGQIERILLRSIELLTQAEQLIRDLGKEVKAG